CPPGKDGGGVARETDPMSPDRTATDVSHASPGPRLLRPADERAGRPLVVGHRGNSSVAPQNTLAAFEAAWRAGADAIELDVRLTADRRTVVLHDAGVVVTTDGTGRVDTSTLSEVRALDVRSTFSRACSGQRVPTFAE